MSDLHEGRVEAAAKALWELHAKLDDPLWESGELDYGIKQIYRKDARAALVAAQGAAPQAEAYDHCCQHPKCPGGSLCCCASEQRLRDCWNQWREGVAGDTKQAFRDAYSAGRNDPAPWAVAPAPSSGVDEDALSECSNHRLVQHRDGRPPWCNACGRAAMPDAATRLRAERDAEVAAKALEEFADAQDSWCEQGRADQVISREAMRDALRARAAECRKAAQS